MFCQCIFILIPAQYGRLKRIAAFLILYMAVNSALWSSPQKTAFLNYSVSEGLSHKTVTSIDQDSDGFLWIGTTNGLNRFDGYGFRRYMPGNAAYSLKGTIISAVACGQGNLVWLSTSAGIEYLDKTTEKFYRLDIPDLAGLNFNQMISVCDSGLVWLYSPGTEFIAYCPASGEVKHRLGQFPGLEDIAPYRFIAFKGYLWLSTIQGIARHSIYTGETEMLYSGPLHHCFTAQLADTNTIVFSHMFDGVYIINIAEKRGSWIKKAELEKATGSKTALYAATTDSSGRLWAGAAPGLISYKDGQAKLYSHYQKDNYFSGDIVSCVYRGTGNTIWLGTFENGLYIKKHENPSFKLHDRLNSLEMYRSIISNMNLFPNGSLLYSDTRGLYFCQSVAAPDGCAIKLYSDAITNVYPSFGNECFVSIVDTVFIFSSITRKMTRLLVAGAISTIMRDSLNKRIWVGTWTGSLLQYSYSGKLLGSSLVDTTEQSYIPIFAIEGAADSSLWLGTFGTGLINISAPASLSPKRRVFSNTSDIASSIGSDMVHCLHTDKQGNLWAGTNGGGLSKLSAASWEIERFTAASGLRSDIIESVISDSKGNIWIASSLISVLDSAGSPLAHYAQSDGISGSFVAKACAIGSGGRLFFSSSNGLLSFHPDSISHKPEISTPIFTGLRIRGHSIGAGDTIEGYLPYTESITYTGQINLPYALNSFGVEFASINFRDFSAIIYEYMLEGADRSWVPSSSASRLANYSGLQPGSYIFKVRAGIGSGKWSQPRVLHINISPPWWRTWWFKGIAALTLATLAISLVAQRINSIKRYSQLLETKVEQRTQKLETAYAALRDKQIVLEMKSTQLQDALDSKDKLINVLAHDFKNPISGIAGLCGLIEKENQHIKSSKIAGYSASIVSAATSILKQMAELLDWAKKQDEEIVSNPVEVSISVLLQDAIKLIKTSAAQKEISISTIEDFRYNAFADPLMISAVIRNILTNSIKFTPRKGCIVASIAELDTTIELTVIDSGIGIDSRSLQLILGTDASLHTPGTENEEGYGIGLRLCKNFIEKNSGTFTIESDIGQGTVFAVSLPKGQTKAAIIDAGIPAQQQAASVISVKRRAGTVLVIEDTESVLESIAGSLSEMYLVIKAKDGHNGLRLAKHAMPDIVVSDIGLPSMNGLEICTELKGSALTSHIPVILISSESGKETVDMAYNCGANDFIEKPIDTFHLSRKIDALLDYRYRHKQRAAPYATGCADAPAAESCDNKPVKRALDFVHANIGSENLNANLVASEVGLSRTQLWRVFKNATGTTISEYILEARMKKAAEMVLSGQYRISEVAYSVGYADPRYFSLSFKKEYGLSPTEYAESKKGTNQ
jgi:signal transduction histidine kinase/AraC-like DNA-binding protein/ligand-binding sensor domain-containing protein/CheY-like chemotaxis protein